MRRFRGLFQTENSTRKGEQYHEQTRPTHRSFAEELSGYSTRGAPNISNTPALSCVEPLVTMMTSAGARCVRVIHLPRITGLGYVVAILSYATKDR